MLAPWSPNAVDPHGIKSLRLTIIVLAVIAALLQALVVHWPAPAFVIGLVQGAVMVAAFWAGQFYAAIKHIDEMTRQRSAR